MLFKHNRNVNVSVVKMALVNLETVAEYVGGSDMGQKAMMFTLK